MSIRLAVTVVASWLAAVGPALAAGAESDDSTEKLAKAAQNPVANLISLT